MKATLIAFFLAALSTTAFATGKEAPTPGKAIAKLPGHVAELTATDDGVSLKVREPNGALPESVAEPKLTLLVGKEKREVAMDGKDGDFSGRADLKGVAHFVALLTVKVDGKPASCRFTVDRVSK